MNTNPGRPSTEAGLPPAPSAPGKAVAASRVEVATAGFRNDVPTAVSGLWSADPRIRRAALSALARMGSIESRHLLDGLLDTETSVARRAVEISATLHRDRPDVDRLLLELLLGDNDVLVEVASFALGERHQEAPGSPLVRDVVERLSDIATTHADPLAREAAVAALGSIGQRDGLAAVLRAVADKATVRRRAVLALAAFDGDEVDAALERARGDRDWQVRQAAEDLTNPRA